MLTSEEMLGSTSLVSGLLEEAKGETGSSWQGVKALCLGTPCANRRAFLPSCFPLFSAFFVVFLLHVIF